MLDGNAPIIIAASQHSWNDRDVSRSPVDALEIVANKALSQAVSPRLRGAIDAIASVRFITDTNEQIAALMPRNPGQLLASRLGIKEAGFFQGPIGGNSPQYMVNEFSRRLANGEHQAVLLCGVELLDTFFYAMKTGADIASWAADSTQQPTTVGVDREGLDANERTHGLYEPIITYPLFENALRHHKGGTFIEQQMFTAQLCNRMSTVAASNEYAWRPNIQSAESIGAVSDTNRWISYPYTRAMNAVLAVDMAAALILTTVRTAQELGIDSERWIYLRAGAELNEIWHPVQRQNFYSSPAIGQCAGVVLEQASLSLDEITLFDIYSCFPIAVEIACREIGLSPMDSRNVTVTGGLPYFGGPGNNYSLHAIAEMVEQLRARGEGNGLVTANGLYLTKHSMGLYSTDPVEHAWVPIDTSALQQAIDQGPTVTTATQSSGTAIIETYTVNFDRNGPAKAIVAARNSARERVLAISENPLTMFQMIESDAIGAELHFFQEEGVNRFEL